MSEPTVVETEQLRRLQEILDRPEFRAAEGQGDLLAFMEPVRTLLLAALLTVLRWLGAAFSTAEDAPGTVITLVAFVIAVGAVFIFLRLVRGNLVTDGALQTEAAQRAVGAAEEWERALRLSRAGDLRGAVHHHYLAVLRRLDERGVLPFERSMTNVEHLRRASQSTALRDALGPLVSAFDRLWYGHSGCTPSEYDEFVRLAKRVWGSGE